MVFCVANTQVKETNGDWEGKNYMPIFYEIDAILWARAASWPPSLLESGNDGVAVGENEDTYIRH